MPTYDYLCRKCGHRFELFHSMKDEDPKRCPRCRGRATRVPGGGAGILFKGSGFHITDYRSRDYKKKAKAEKGGGGGKGDSAGKPEVKKKDTPKGDGGRGGTSGAGGGSD